MIKKGSPILISRQDLLDYVSEEEIAFKYVHGFSKVDKSFKSEFRAEDIPSSRLFWGKHGYLMFKDFGDPNIPEALSMIQYVAHKYQIDEQAAINKIAQDFGLIGGSSELNIVGKRNKVKKVKQNSPSDLIIKIKRRDFQQHDIEYWNQFGISLDILNKNNVKAISHLFYGNSPPIEFSKNHLVYSLDYYVHEGIFRRKIYQPLSLTDKWKSNCDFSIVQHYNRTPKEGGDLLFIQSSLKDCMVMEVMGYYSVAPNAESTWLPDYYWNKLKERWENIVIMFDNDDPGIAYAQRLSDKYNIPYIHTPINEPKDISDFVKEYGLLEGNNLIKKLIK